MPRILESYDIQVTFPSLRFNLKTMKKWRNRWTLKAFFFLIFIKSKYRIMQQYRQRSHFFIFPFLPSLFQPSIRNCLNCVKTCDDHGLLDFKSAVQYMKYFIYHFTKKLYLIRAKKPYLLNKRSELIS